MSKVTALPTKPRCGPVAAALVAQHDQLRLGVRALGHRGERAHAARDDLRRGPSTSNVERLVLRRRAPARARRGTSASRRWRAGSAGRARRSAASARTRAALDARSSHAVVGRDLERLRRRRRRRRRPARDLKRRTGRARAACPRRARRPRPSPRRRGPGQRLGARARRARAGGDRGRHARPLGVELVALAEARPRSRAGRPSSCVTASLRGPAFASPESTSAWSGPSSSDSPSNSRHHARVGLGLRGGARRGR